MRRALRFSFLALLALAVTAADAAEITNVARVTWSEGGATRSLQSNPVTLAVEALPQLTTWTPDPGAPVTQLVAAQSCQASGTQAAASVATTGVRVALAAMTAVRAGQTMVLVLAAPDANRDPLVAEQLVATVTTTGGDRESATLRETGVDTGVFTAALPTTDAVDAPSPGNCVIELGDSDQIQVSVASPRPGAPPILLATVAVLVDPRGRVFDSSDGTPVTGASVSLVDADTGAPATVFADDGKTSWPASLVSGMPVTDGAGVTTTTVAGGYKFPLVRPGRYRLVVRPPAPYLAPSVATPAQMATLTRPSGLPFTLTDGSYGRAFSVDGSGAVRVDIPLDAPTTPATITKTASRAEAAPGDAMVYTVSVTNPDPAHVRRDLVVTDRLPPGLRLRVGSVRVNGAAPASGPTIGADGRSLAIALGQVAARATVAISYAADIRPDAAAG